MMWVTSVLQLSMLRERVCNQQPLRWADRVIVCRKWGFRSPLCLLFFLSISLVCSSEVSRKYRADPDPERPRKRHDCHLEPVFASVIDGLGEGKGRKNEKYRTDRHLP